MVRFLIFKLRVDWIHACLAHMKRLLANIFFFMFNLWHWRPQPCVSLPWAIAKFVLKKRKTSARIWCKFHIELWLSLKHFFDEVVWSRCFDKLFRKTPPSLAQPRLGRRANFCSINAVFLFNRILFCCWDLSIFARRGATNRTPLVSVPDSWRCLISSEPRPLGLNHTDLIIIMEWESTCSIHSTPNDTPLSVLAESYIACHFWMAYSVIHASKDLTLLIWLI